MSIGVIDQAEFRCLSWEARPLFFQWLAGMWADFQWPCLIAAWWFACLPFYSVLLLRCPAPLASCAHHLFYVRSTFNRWILLQSFDNVLCGCRLTCVNVDVKVNSNMGVVILFVRVHALVCAIVQHKAMHV